MAQFDKTPDEIFQTVWSLWHKDGSRVNVRALIRGLRDAGHTEATDKLFNYQRRGDLPPAEFDIEIVKQSRRVGRPLLLADLAWYRRQRAIKAA
jgi:hypothetical protein